MGTTMILCAYMVFHSQPELMRPLLWLLRSCGVRWLLLQEACIRHGALELAVAALSAGLHVAIAMSTTRVIYTLCHVDTSCHAVRFNMRLMLGPHVIFLWSHLGVGSVNSSGISTFKTNPNYLSLCPCVSRVHSIALMLAVLIWRLLIRGGMFWYRVFSTQPRPPPSLCLCQRLVQLEIVPRLLSTITAWIQEENVVHEAIQVLITMASSPDARPGFKQALVRWGAVEVMYQVLDANIGKSVKVRFRWCGCCTYALCGVLYLLCVARSDLRGILS